LLLSLALSIGDAPPPLVTKRELVNLLRISRPTLDAWIDRWPDFPIEERGDHGRSYRFDPHAVCLFLSEKKQAEADRRAERDEALAQLVLPFASDPEPPRGPSPSLDDQIKAIKLNKLKIEQARDANELVEVARIRDLGRGFMLNLAQDLHAFLSRLAREQGWPGPVLQSHARALDELMQRRADADMAAILPTSSDLANGTDDARSS
jgi:phage terminase Nu1 subunit (DNA packaging protein)